MVPTTAEGKLALLEQRLKAWDPDFLFSQFKRWNQGKKYLFKQRNGREMPSLRKVSQVQLQQMNFGL